MTQIELENKIKYYQQKYYDGQEEISDAEFDKLWDQLSSEYPNSLLLKKVGEDAIKGKKVKHIMLMGSQSKFNTYEGLCDWIKKESITFPVLVESKVDGNSAELQYENGFLTAAASRGDGTVGEDITRVLKHIIPNTIETKEVVAIRGEVVMNRSLFEDKYSKDFKNPRNLTAGLLKNESFNDFTDLRFIAYDTNKEFTTELEKYEWLKSQNFDVVDMITCNTTQEVEDYHNKRNNKDMPFDIDGLILRQNIIDPKDVTEYRPSKIHAYKWSDETVETTLTGIEWSLTGNTLTPVAEFEPIEIEGATVKRASLSNPSFIIDNNLKIGDVIAIQRRGMIIPHVEEIVDHCGTVDIEIPKVCPVCGSELVMREGNTRLYCNNPECKTFSVARLNKWISTLDVKGFGPAMIDSLVYDYNVNSIIDLYDRDFVDNYFCKTYGSINARKAFDDLYAKSTITLAQFIAGYNLGNIGIDMAQTIIDAGFDAWPKVYNITKTDLLNIEGWSDIRADKFLEAFDLAKDEMLDVLDYINFKEENKKVNEMGLKICVTGALNRMPRKQFEEYLISKGCTLASSVSKTTDILVTNDTESGSSKNKKAKELNIPIKTEDEIFEMLGD